MSTDHTTADVWADDQEPLVAGPKRRQLSSWQKIGVAALVTIVFLAFIWVDYALNLKNANPQPELAFKPKSGTFEGAPITLPPQNQVPSIDPAAAKPDTAHQIRPEDSPLLIFGSGSAGQMAASVGGAAGQLVPSLGGGGAGGADGALASRLKPTVLQGSKAGLLPHPDLLITKGTIMPCTLQTAINTELAGFVKCVLSEDVRGTTGNVVLLDRGTTIVGEVQSAMAQGTKRAFVLWDRAETPGHAVVDLASPGADELGQAGVPGKVDNHFWARFGSAILMSVIQGSLQAGTALAANSGSGGGTTFNSFQSNGQGVASDALTSNMNIPPTLKVSQGANVSIFVARDMDFSDVYKLEVKN